MRILFVIFCALSFMLGTNIVEAAGYGWGYQKKNNQEIPDVGKYKEIIEGHQAYYADFSEEKNIYLTFDNGYEQGYTEEILDTLKKLNVPATFFVTGHYVKDQPALIKRMVEDGHIIGNHSHSHPDFTTLSKEEIKKELDLVKDAVAKISDQKEMNFLRPPRGTFSEKTLAHAEELGYVHVFWSVAFHDWDTNKQKGWQYAYDQIIEQIHPGAIILLHTVSEDNAKALERVIVELKRQGYQFKSLNDLLVKNNIPSIT